MTVIILHGLLSTQAGRFVVADSILFSYVASTVLGMPVYFIWQRCGWTSWLAYMGGAYVTATVAIPAIGFQYVFWHTHRMAAVLWVASQPNFYVDCAVCGVLGSPFGLLFWFIVRPDRL